MSSRIIVKNIPKNITENELKKHFSVKGDVTDVKIIKKDNGVSRNFCFIGFRDESSALDAVQYFNNTYIHTVKIIVELAKIQGDPSLIKKGNKSIKDNNNENSKQFKIKKILELAQKTKNADKFDSALVNKKKKI